LFPLVLLSPALSAYLAAQPADSDVSAEAARMLLARELKFVRRSRTQPLPEALLARDDPQLDEIEVQPLPEALKCVIAAAEQGRAASAEQQPRTATVASSSEEECGWVFRSDPLLHASLLLHFSRAHYSAALRTMVCPALVLHARTQSSSRDRPFVAHIDSLLAGSPYCDPADPTNLSGSSAGVREIVADRLMHLEPDDDSADDCARAVGELLRDVWNNRANLRREAAAHHARQVNLAKRVRTAQKKMEQDFYATTPPALLQAKL
jgi:hypothetical protein